ncbi:hypothetical protein L1987_13053 [Smallanthus sonchifolius]|uniref:Uncharacterized protein n=1 Tax=Smallanthus sonchifolius TaxID=185202 RepID=A0ACB9JHT9_9ASTR|nr:hypothetical protein L1987_13053 [Smallanthus sonchifolius]
MTRSISNARVLSSFVVDQISVASRRGYAVISTGNVSGAAMMKKGGEESKVSNPWVPDPVTGYYKPEDQTKQVDAADLRGELFLKQKNRRQ